MAYSKLPTSELYAAVPGVVLLVALAGLVALQHDGDVPEPVCDVVHAWCVDERHALVHLQQINNC